MNRLPDEPNGCDLRQDIFRLVSTSPPENPAQTLWWPERVTRQASGGPSA